MAASVHATESLDTATFEYFPSSNEQTHTITESLTEGIETPSAIRAFLQTLEIDNRFT